MTVSRETYDVLRVLAEQMSNSVKQGRVSINAAQLSMFSKALDEALAALRPVKKNKPSPRVDEVLKKKK